MRRQWVQLPGAWKTEQADQAINLLKAYHIHARTLPDEFNGRAGSRRMEYMDSEIMWPIFVREYQADRALSILADEQLY